MESSQLSPVPDGQRLFPYLIVRDAARALAFYQQAFDAREKYRLEMGSKIGHAELSFAGVTIWLADEFPEQGFLGPAGSSPVSIVVYVQDVDGLVERAVAAGATLERPIRDEFYGDRTGVLRDPFGHRWLFHARRERVTPEEMRRRMASAAAT